MWNGPQFLKGISCKWHKWQAATKTGGKIGKKAAKGKKRKNDSSDSESDFDDDDDYSDDDFDVKKKKKAPAKAAKPAAKSNFVPVVVSTKPPPLKEPKTAAAPKVTSSK